MSDLRLSVEKFLANNPLPATSNQLLNQALAELRVVFLQLWQFKTVGAMLLSKRALERCAREKRGALFIRQWEAWQKALMDQINLFFSLLFNMGTVNADCALPDPATWACELLYLLIKENFFLLMSSEHVVDGWIKHVCSRSPVRIWEAPGIRGYYGVSASNEEIRDSDLIISVLHKGFETKIFEHLFEVRGFAWLRLTQQGWRPAREDSPILILTVQDLKRLPPRDPQLKSMMRAIFPKLQQEILDVRSAPPQEQISIAAIRQKFPLLRDVSDDLIQRWVLRDPKNISESTAAKEILAAYAGNVSPKTVDRYTRYFSDARKVTAKAKPHSKYFAGFLHNKLLVHFEESLVATNKCA